MNKRINNSWDDLLVDEFEAPYFQSLEKFVDDEYSKYTCFPKEENIFNAFKLTPIENIKVVILGQDPYINENQAMGLAFSVPKGIDIPPSLVNIYKEMVNDVHIDPPSSGDLTGLAKAGVFLLNSTLTVRKGMSLSHFNQGWEIFTDHVIQIIQRKKIPVVFILWGKKAGEKDSLITNKSDLILKAPHPSPLSAYNGFFGSKPFSKCNNFLRSNEINPIDWSVVSES